MSNALNTMLAQVAQYDPDLSRRIKAEFDSQSTGVGLVWERHAPESVTLPDLAPRVGRCVMLLPPRGIDADALRRSKKKVDRERVDPLWGSEWQIKAMHVDGDTSQIELHRKVIGAPVGVAAAETDEDAEDAESTEAVADDIEHLTWPVEDLVSIAKFTDPIFPGLKKTGEVRGTDDPSAPEHIVINSENYHALQMLTYTHTGSIDAIYIDPPYNTGAKDWKYNNAFVDTDDKFRHSKWLSFMERRLLVAKKLLNPKDSVLIVTIDEKEYLNLGILLRQTFPEARIQMVSSVINPKGVARAKEFRRTDEYLYVVMLGASVPGSVELDTSTKTGLRWAGLMRTGTGASRLDSPGCFYPIYIRNTEAGPVFAEVGEAPDLGGVNLDVPGLTQVWPVRPDGRDGRWMHSPESLRRLISIGHVRLGKWREGRTSVSYLAKGNSDKVLSGQVKVIGHAQDGSVILADSAVVRTSVPSTQWNISSHSASEYGTSFINAFHGESRFTFPKNLYAVEDALRFFVKDKPDATILDFFSGSGTTAHAVMRLNKQDGGRRKSISVTNNEVSADEQAALYAAKHRPGDPEWDRLGIADYVTKPRVEAAITGKRASDGEPIKGDYKFTDEFPMKDGFAANASFWTLTYEDPKFIELGLAFERIAPLLWLQAGQRGQMITEEVAGYAIADTYAVLFDCDLMGNLADELTSGEHDEVKHVFVITDHDVWWQDANDVFKPILGQAGIHRLYKSYLSNFEIEGGK